MEHRSFSGAGATDVSTGLGKFNAFNNSITTGDFAVLAAGGSATVSETINPAEWADGFARIAGITDAPFQRAI